ncbi:MAG TPA: hypothetical protein PLO86_07860 [Syntrophales bacterium]|nr:hypothetical protein [Syntrophales bacterium]
MIPKIWLVNLGLAFLVVFSGIRAAGVWFQDDRSIVTGKVSEKPVDRVPEKKMFTAALPPESSYAPVVEKNLFSPDRKEPAAAQEPAAESKGEIAELKIPGKKVALYGVVLVDDFRKALITNLEKKGKERDVIWVREGETVGTFKVARIEKDKVFLEENGRQYEIALYSDDKPERRTVAVPEGKPSVIAPEGEARKESAPPAPAVESKGGAPPSPRPPSVAGEKGGDDEYEVISTPFGQLKRKKK